MPWFDVGHRRERPEEGATLQHIWATVRVLREHAGGIFNTVSTIALQVSRQDARLESLGADLAQLRRAMTERLGQLVRDDEEGKPDE